MRYITILLMLILTGCGQQKQETTADTAIREDLPAVREKGMEISKKAFGTLSGNLQQAVSEGGVSYALKFCNVEAIPLTDSLSEQSGIEIRRASHRPRNPANEADSLEMETIKKYLAKIENNEDPAPITYRYKKSFIYHAPIRINNGLCLSCHGQPGSDITEENLSVINELYPKDRATGFNMGDLRGIWSIRFPEAALDSL